MLGTMVTKGLGGGESWKRLTFHVSKDFDFHMLKRRIQEILGRCLKCIPLMGLQNTHVIVSYVAIFCGGFCHQTCGVCVCVCCLHIHSYHDYACNKQTKKIKERSFHFNSYHTVRFAYQSNTVNLSINITSHASNMSTSQFPSSFPTPRDVHILQLPHTHRHGFFHQQRCRLLHGQREVWGSAWVRPAYLWSSNCFGPISSVSWVSQFHRSATDGLDIPF